MEVSNHRGYEKHAHLTLFEASTMTGQIIIQLAKLGGLKVVGVAELSKHQQLLQSLGTGKLA